MKQSRTNSGILFFCEKIIRSHPLIYFISRSLIRFTNIAEKDFNGVKLLNLKNKANVIDVGASDGIASKFFNRNLSIGSITCFEPNNYYVKILKKTNIKNLIIKPFAIGNRNGYKTIFFPRYKFFSKNLDLPTYTFYDQKILIRRLLLDFKFRKNISIIKKKIFIKRVKKINKKIDLIKIDVNGFDLSVIKGLIYIIKKDRPALIVETAEVPDHDKKIARFLKKFSYKSYYFLSSRKKFSLVKNKYSENTFFLQKNHLI